MRPAARVRNTIRKPAPTTSIGKRLSERARVLSGEAGRAGRGRGGAAAGPRESAGTEPVSPLATAAGNASGSSSSVVGSARNAAPHPGQRTWLPRWVSARRYSRPQGGQGTGKGTAVLRQ